MPLAPLDSCAVHRMSKSCNCLLVLCGQGLILIQLQEDHLTTSRGSLHFRRWRAYVMPSVMSHYQAYSCFFTCPSC